MPLEIIVRGTHCEQKGMRLVQGRRGEAYSTVVSERTRVSIRRCGVSEKKAERTDHWWRK
jgi:CDGSH-type Zn-finger protein